MSKLYNAIYPLRSLLVSFLAVTATAAPGEIRLNNFRIRQTVSENAPRWELEAESAVTSGNNVGVENVTVKMRLKNGAVVVISSPHAVLDRESKTIRSTAPITIVSESFTLRGTGYDMFTDEQRVFLRQDVQMTIPSSHLASVGDNEQPRLPPSDSPAPGPGRNK